MTPAIRVSNLRVTYPGQGRPVTAVDGVSFDVASGEVVAIIGRSGSGKTSLMRVLSGILRPFEGRVEVAGQVLDPRHDPARDYFAHVGLAFQNYGLVPQLTPVENVLCGGLYRQGALGLSRFADADVVKARELLAEFGLGERLGLASARLSGGEQQRVAMARLLMQAPDVMLLDEPIASLDVHWSQHALKRLKDARGGTGTIVMVLHDLGMVRQFADRVLLMDRGCLVFDGPADEGCDLLESMGAEEPRGAAKAAGEGGGAAVGPGPVVEPGMELDKRRFSALILLAILAACIWAAWSIPVSPERVLRNLGSVGDFLGRLVPPDLSVGATVLESLLETVQMALLGTALASVFALPVAMAAARNIAPRPVQVVARFVLNVLRTVPSIIWGLFFVVMVGLGPFPGILALTVYAVGYLGKFYYEGIESIDPNPVVALRTVGASAMQRFRFGIFPQVLPLLAGYTLYMFEYNVRAASILGVVGAGGVGFYLYAYINNFQYQKATTTLLLLLALVTIIDAVSSRLRARLRA